MHTYTDEQLGFLRENAPKFSRRELTKKFNEKFGTDLSLSAVKTACRRRGYFANREDLYTAEQLEFLRENAGEYSREELTELFNKKFGENRTLSGIAHACKSRKWNAKTDGRFYKGQPHWSEFSDKTWREHYSDEAYANMIEALDRGRQTRKLHKGETVMRRFGDRHRPYVVVTEDENVPSKSKVVPKARYVWESHHGKLPEGYHIVFLDGDNNNFDIENLAIVTKKQWQIMVKERWYGKGEVTKTGIAYAQLMEAIKERRE